jgi:hypothetical protein
MVARLKSYVNLPPDEFVWEFGSYDEAAAKHRLWSELMADGLWVFTSWGPDNDLHLIKPGALSELDLRTVGDRL